MSVGNKVILNEPNPCAKATSRVDLAPKIDAPRRISQKQRVPLHKADSGGWDCSP